MNEILRTDFADRGLLAGTSLGGIGRCEVDGSGVGLGAAATACGLCSRGSRLIGAGEADADAGEADAGGAEVGAGGTKAAAAGATAIGLAVAFIAFAFSIPRLADFCCSSLFAVIRRSSFTTLGTLISDGFCCLGDVNANQRQR